MSDEKQGTGVLRYALAGKHTTAKIDFSVYSHEGTRKISFNQIIGKRVNIPDSLHFTQRSIELEEFVGQLREKAEGLESAGDSSSAETVRQHAAALSALNEKDLLTDRLTVIAQNTAAAAVHVWLAALTGIGQAKSDQALVRSLMKKLLKTFRMD